MQIKNLLSIALGMLLVCSMFAGCGNTAGPSSTESVVSSEKSSVSTAPDNASSVPAESTEPVTIKWAVWDFETTQYYQDIINAYKEAAPNVTVECVDLGSADFMTMLSTQLSGGADLDVLTMKDIPGYANLIRQNHLEPLNDYISSSGIDTSLYGGTVEQITVDGNIYALPFRSDFWIVFYNKDLFDAVNVPYPTNDMTFKQYDELARQVTNGSGAGKVYGSHYHTWRSAVQLFGILDGKNTIVDGTYEFLKPYYEMVLKQQTDGICQDYATLKTSSTHYSGVFYNNQVAMMNMGSWFISSQITSIEKGESLATNWGIVKYPHADGVAPGTTLGTITSLAVNNKSENKEAAREFLKFVTGSDGAVVFAKSGIFPAIKNDEVIALISSMDGFPQDENSKSALATAKTYLEMPLSDKSSDIEIVLNECHDNIMTGNATIDEGILDMNTRVQEILAE